MCAAQCQLQPPEHRLHQDDRVLADLQPPQALCGYPSADLHPDTQTGNGGSSLEED